MPKIQPFLWFDTQAEEAVQFYVSIFKNSRILDIIRYGENAPQPSLVGAAMTISFELDGVQMVALNGGPVFKFSEAISLLTAVETQDEIDYLWEKLCSDGGAPGLCGWLKDKYGVSWQVTSSILTKALDDSDKERADRVMRVLQGMKKIVIAELQAAYDGGS
jgi:predicted 3-demethylubiquinone-9 3-methyltransferase (glyoxalase superfamily)